MKNTQIDNLVILVAFIVLVYISTNNQEVRRVSAQINKRLGKYCFSNAHYRSHLN